MVKILSTEDKILKVALELFSKFGYSGVSTKQIARESGVNEVTIFRKFESKSNLFQQVITRYAKEGNVIEKLKSELTGDLEKDLSIFGTSFYRFLLNNELMYKLQVKQVDEESMKFTNSLKYKEFFSGYLKEAENAGKFKGDPERVAVLFISTIMGIFTFRIFTKDMVAKVDIDEIIQEEAGKIVKLYMV